MRFGIRLRFAVWLLAALVPVGLASAHVFSRIEEDVAVRLATDLEGVRSLEASRIESAIRSYLEHGETLAGGPNVSEFTARVVQAIEAGVQSEPIGGFDGFSPVDAFAERPLQELAFAMQRNTDAATNDVAALRIVGRNGAVLGETPGFDWEPYDGSLIQQAMDSGQALVGNAYRDSDGGDRIGLVLPIVHVDAGVVGALVLENELGPIVDLAAQHESFGATSEAHLAQRDPEGNTEFITQLRFDRDAAFTKVVPAGHDGAIHQSLDSRGGMVIFGKDYRGEDSILAMETIESTGWGLVAKIDSAEALSPVLRHTNELKAVAALGLIGVLVGWAVLLDPVARRLRLLAEGAERVANGDYESPLDDRDSDELGSVAKSIDRLAIDLAADRAVREDIENRLRHQATHDTTTELFNRQYATALMEELAKAVDTGGEDPFSLLFLDLDDFKTINDDFGHPTGDAVLVETAARLQAVVGARGSAARWGGDEFVVVLPRTSAMAAHAMAVNLRQAFRAPVIVDGVVLHTGASIGVAAYDSARSLDSLLLNADVSMFAEKQKRPARHASEGGVRRTVQRAIEDRSIEVWFQPLVVRTGENVTLEGAEALLRLRDEHGSLIPTGTLIADVERLPLGRDLDRLVIETAVGQVGEWISAAQLASNFRLSVNCGAALMRDTATPDFIADTLRTAGVDAQNLMIEVGEILSSLRPQVLEELVAMGITIAIADLDHGSSDMDQFARGASVAKIESQWLEQAKDEEARVLLSDFVAICDANGFDVIAERVETLEQYTQLCDLGVSSFQGFLFAEPMPVRAFVERFMHDS